MTQPVFARRPHPVVECRHDRHHPPGPGDRVVTGANKGIGREVWVNAAVPGACATDLTKDLGLDVTRTAADGAAIVVRLATLGPDGPGGSFDDDGPVRW
jgi:hypothetical protein